MYRNRHHKWIETRKPNHRMPVYNRNYQYWKFYFNLFETYRHLFLLRHNMTSDGRFRDVHHGHMCSISDHVFNHRCKILVLPMLRHLVLVVADRIEFICMWTNTNLSKCFAWNIQFQRNEICKRRNYVVFSFVNTFVWNCKLLKLCKTWHQTEYPSWHAILSFNL